MALLFSLTAFDIGELLRLLNLDFVGKNSQMSVVVLQSIYAIYTPDI